MMLEWMNAAEAAELLGVAEKTFRRKAAGLETRLQPMTGRKPERQWRGEDIRALAEPAREPQVIQPEAAAPPRAGALIVAPPRRPGASNGSEGALAVAAALEALVAPSTRPPLPLWLKLDQAAAYSGLSVACLRSLCKTSAIVSVRDRSLKISRASLDRYAEGSP